MASYSNRIGDKRRERLVRQAALPFSTLVSWINSTLGEIQSSRSTVHDRDRHCHITASLLFILLLRVLIRKQTTFAVWQRVSPAACRMALVRGKCEQSGSFRYAVVNRIPYRDILITLGFEQSTGGIWIQLLHFCFFASVTTAGRQ